jgi:glycosidase
MRPIHDRLPLALLLALALAACAGAPPAAVKPAAAPAAWDHDWARGAVFYEVFVRSFADSNGDGIGDLQGLISRLDYLNDGNPATTQDLGVDALWLMPVFDSPSYHGYDTVDYERIEPDYGTNADFERLLAEAHRRGIRIIVDYVMNHSSSKHPWFVESASSPASPRRDWYEWRADDPGWRQPWGGGPTWHKSPREDGTFYYGIFWSGMPDLNWRTPALRDEMNRIAADWLRRGVDGFRLDATRHLVANGPGEGQNNQPETHEALKDFAAHVRGVSPTAMLVGENWTDTPSIATYYGDLPMNFNFPLAEEIVRGVEAGEAAGIAAKLSEMADLYPAGALDAPFLTNHDMVRLATQLANDPAKLKSAAAILLTLPGAPFLYYGEEVGLQNGGADRADELKRTPMPWDATPGGGFTTASKPWYAFAPGRETSNVAAQTGDPSSLLSHYRNLIRARKSSEALRRGSLELLTSENRSSPGLAFFREHEGERVLVIHNLDADGGSLHTVRAEALEPIFVSEGTPAPTKDGEDGWAVQLPAGASGVWRVR